VMVTDEFSVNAALMGIQMMGVQLIAYCWISPKHSCQKQDWSNQCLFDLILKYVYYVGL
jgi:hypothetical protein